MGLIILLIVGGLIGWVASMIMRTDGQQGVLLNVYVAAIMFAMALPPAPPTPITAMRGFNSSTCGGLI